MHENEPAQNCARAQRTNDKSVSLFVYLFIHRFFFESRIFNFALSAPHPTPHTSHPPFQMKICVIKSLVHESIPSE